MKVYKFYKIPDEDDREGLVEDRYLLYAITNDKKLAERFMEDRNMKKFIIKKDTGFTKEEYVELCNEDRGCVLELYEVVTIFKNQHTKKNSIKKEILMTYNEIQMLEDIGSYIEDESYWKSQPYPLIFKSKYVNMLDKLQYITFYKLLNIESLSHNLLRKISKDDDDYTGPSLIFDEAAKFISIISDTL